MRTHNPSRRQAIFFLFFTVLLASGIFLWVFFLNKGMLAVRGNTPFKLAAGNYEKMCEVSLCSITLKPKKYVVTVFKEGFFPYTETVDIVRNETATVTPQFIFIPLLRERTSGIPIFDAKKENPFFLEKSASGQLLKKRVGAGSEAILSFERQFKNPVLLSNTKETQVLLIEKQDSSTAYYLVDTLGKLKKRLEVAQTAIKPKWVGDFIVFEDGQDSNKKVFMVNAASFLQIELPAADSENVIERQPGVFVFVSVTKQDSQGPKFGPLISEVLEETKNELFDSSRKPSVWFITEFALAEGIMKTIVTVPANSGQSIQRLTADPDGKRLYFEKGGKIFEVIYNAPPS